MPDIARGIGGVWALPGMDVSGIDRSMFSQATLFDDGREQHARLDAEADSRNTHSTASNNCTGT